MFGRHPWRIPERRRALSIAPAPGLRRQPASVVEFMHSTPCRTSFVVSANTTGSRRRVPRHYRRCGGVGHPRSGCSPCSRALCLELQVRHDVGRPTMLSLSQGPRSAATSAVISGRGASPALPALPQAGTGSGAASVATAITSRSSQACPRETNGPSGPKQLSIFQPDSVAWLLTGQVVTV